MHGVFAEVAGLLLICALAGAVFVRLRQPGTTGSLVDGNQASMHREGSAFEPAPSRPAVPRRGEKGNRA